ncbi:MAG: DNA replication/repair protein RecF [Capsulimonadales bacterium]|nr:DNA replication/repair protein RecF [Capsulimonadales bacterium]
MHITRLELFDFRNYTTLRWEPLPGLNLIVGPNAQGKTNLLEAIYLLATTKSVRAGRDGEMVRFGADACRVAAEVRREQQGDVLLEIAIASPTATNIGGERKIVKVNHGKQARVTDLIGHVNAVLFSSVDLDIVRGEPEDRRRFLNYEISQVSPRYALAYGSYRRSLEQRNRLLKDIKYGQAGLPSLETWTLQVAEHGARLIERRRAYVEKLAVHTAAMHRSLTENRETVAPEYAPSFPLAPGVVTVEEVKTAFIAALGELRREELQRGTTLLGPQRDDLRFSVGATPETAVEVQTYGSQGQQRTTALSLRLAERQLIEEMVGEPPVVLLDDVLSDLDEYRRARIFELALSEGQTFLTTTDLAAIPPEAIAQAAIWRVAAGTVERTEAP